MDQLYDKDYWTELPPQADEIDKLIEEFNKDVGLIQKYQ